MSGNEPRQDARSRRPPDAARAERDRAELARHGWFGRRALLAGIGRSALYAPLMSAPLMSAPLLSASARSGSGVSAAGTAARASGRPGHGFDVVESPSAPFGSAAAAASLRAVAALGADSVALIPFLWQPSAGDPHVVLGSGLPLERLASGIAQARACGLAVTVKPHVWVPGSWAGRVAMADEAAWRAWFQGYAGAIVAIAAVAARSGATGLVVGTELRGTIARPEWVPLIARVRQVFHGRLGYMAHGADEAEQVAFWPRLDAVGATLYPVLGEAGAPDQWRRAIAAETARVHRVASRARRPLWIGEIGIRSARDATRRPWESAEERAAPVDLALQADVIAAWLDGLAPARPQLLLVWRWFTDPAAGGGADTDFTVQNKPAAMVLARAWLRSGTTPRR